VNIKDIIERIQFYLTYIKSRWYWILLTVLIITGILVFHASTRPVYYTAITVFHPDAERNVSNSPEGLSFLFGGIDPKNSEMTYMTGLLNSKTLNRSVVMDSVIFQDEKRLVADLILEYNPPYASLPSYIKSFFITPSHYSKMKAETKVRVASSILLSSMELSTNKKTGFAELRVHYYHAELVGILCAQYLTRLRSYYGEQKSVRTQQSIDFYSKRADSIKRELDKVNRSLARDQNRRPYRIFAEDEIYPTELESQQGILSQMFVSLYISQEQARAQQQRELPVIQVIDPPIPPFFPTGPNYLLYGGLGVFVGLFLGLFFVSFKLLRQDTRYLFQEFVVKPIMEGGDSETDGSEETTS